MDNCTNCGSSRIIVTEESTTGGITSTECLACNVRYRVYSDSSKPQVTKLRIMNCSDNLLWYFAKVGDTVPLVREDDYYWSLDQAGHINIIHKIDAIKVMSPLSDKEREPNNEIGDYIVRHVRKPSIDKKPGLWTKLKTTLQAVKDL